MYLLSRYGLLVLFTLLLLGRLGHATEILPVTDDRPKPDNSPGNWSPEITFLGLIKGSDSSSCILPFTQAGNLILIQAQADTTTGNFILDSGAQHLVLNLTYFRQYPRNLVSQASQTGITGTGGAVTTTTINKFSLGTLMFFRTPSNLVNLGHLENSKGVKILGLLGLSLFRQCELIIDFEKKLIYLHRIGRRESNTYTSRQLTDTAAYHTVPILIRDNRIVARTEMAGKKLEFIIDCAAESNLLDSRLPNKILDNVVITKRVMLLGSGDKKIEALAGEFKNMVIGSKTISSLPVMVTKLENTCFSYNGCISGVLGFDFLSLNKVGFNFVKNKIYLWK